jgi:hypothetical protein
MPTGDAVQAPAPTVAEEMAKFSGFTSQDSVTIDPKTEDLNPVQGKNTTANEDAATGKTAGDKVPVITALTDDEADKIITAAEAKKGSELTDEETAKALQDARDAKIKPAGDTPKRSVQQRINQAIRGKNAAEVRATAAEQRSADLEARLAALEKGEKPPLTGTTPAATVNGEAAPDPKDFTYGELDQGYIRALARFETRAELAADRAKQAEKTATDTRTAAEQEAAAQIEAFAEAGNDKYDDFYETVIQGARDGAWPLSAALGAALIESDHGHAIAYRLASDVKEATEIAALSPSKQVAWLGRQEAALDAETGDGKTKGASEDATKVKAKVSAAPAPITRTRGSGAPEASHAAGADFAAFEREAMSQG